MAENSKIEWTEHTANLWWGCTKVHAGCDNCYAETLANRYKINVWGNDVPRRSVKSVWNDFVKYQKAADKAGRIDRVFVGSMMDIFEKPMPLVDSNGQPVFMDPTSEEPITTGYLRHRFFTEVVPNSPNLLFLLLTKRPSNINKYIPPSWKADPPKNVMFGTSPVDQETADKLVPQLLEVKGKKFLSVEPMLGQVTFNPTWLQRRAGKETIDWVICGGESGPKKRPFDVGAARMLYNTCVWFQVPFFMKQIDKVQPIPDDLMIREFPAI
jgi:protein gp37